MSGHELPGFEFKFLSELKRRNAFRVLPRFKQILARLA